MFNLSGDHASGYQDEVGRLSYYLRSSLKTVSDRLSNCLEFSELCSIYFAANTFTEHYRALADIEYLIQGQVHAALFYRRGEGRIRYMRHVIYVALRSNSQDVLTITVNTRARNRFFQRWQHLGLYSTDVKIRKN